MKSIQLLSIITFTLPTALALDPPQTHLFDGKDFQSRSQLAAKGEATTQGIIDGWAQLKIQADTILAAPIINFQEKSHVAPSNKKQDFYSLCEYCFSDNSKPNGLPYITLDGYTNPEALNYTDPTNLHSLIDRLSILSKRWYWSQTRKEAGQPTLDSTGKQIQPDLFAEQAVSLAKAFFVTTSTMMAPNFNYAQSRPGAPESTVNPFINDLKGSLDSPRSFADLLDAIAILKLSSPWKSSGLDTSLADWHTQLFSWLTESNDGIVASQRNDSQATWYDVISTSTALLAGDTVSANKIIGQSSTRLSNQFAPDGSQPFELSRANSWQESVYNLMGWFTLARMADSLTPNATLGSSSLWTAAVYDLNAPLPPIQGYPGDGGRKIRRQSTSSYLQSALDNLATYASGSQTWPYPHLVQKPDPTLLLPLLRLGYWVWGKQQYRDTFVKVSGNSFGNYSDVDVVLTEPTQFSSLAGDLSGTTPEIDTVPANTQPNVPPPTDTVPPQSSGPSFWSIIGIIIAVVICLAILVTLVICILRRKQTRDYTTSSNFTTSGALPPDALAYDPFKSVTTTTESSPNIPRKKMEGYLQNPRLATFADSSKFNQYDDQIELSSRQSLEDWN